MVICSRRWARPRAQRTAPCTSGRALPTILAYHLAHHMPPPPASAPQPPHVPEAPLKNPVGAMDPALSRVVSCRTHLPRLPAPADGRRRRRRRWRRRQVVLRESSPRLALCAKPAGAARTVCACCCAARRCALTGLRSLCSCRTAASSVSHIPCACSCLLRMRSCIRHPLALVAHASFSSRLGAFVHRPHRSGLPARRRRRRRRWRRRRRRRRR